MRIQYLFGMTEQLTGERSLDKLIENNDKSTIASNEEDTANRDFQCHSQHGHNTQDITQITTSGSY